MLLIQKYFPQLTDHQKEQFAQLLPLYEDWNSKINVISRKDMEHFYEHHVLHSLAVAKLIQFKPATEILDVGTGGGFPGIPLAILFPLAKFHLIDSIGKKIKVVADVAEKLALKNLTYEQKRVEQINHKYDFILSRAVTDIQTFHYWVRNLVKKEAFNELDNGIIALKGGDLREEFAGFKHHHRFYNLSNYFEEEYFETKKVVYVKV